jgi:hypothetical protein
MDEALKNSPPRSRGRLWFWLGLLAALAGPPVYALQIGMGRLGTPWYVPALAVLGAALLVRSLLLRGTVWRVLGLLFCVGLAGFESWFIVSYAALPAYNGPLAVDRPFPEFKAALADGAPFTAANLEGEKTTAMVFFRGHW